jgi:hypothetical protein
VGDAPVCRCGTWSRLRFGQDVCACQSRWLFEAGVMTDGKFLIPVGHVVARITPGGYPPAPEPPRPAVGDAMRAEDL